MSRKHVAKQANSGGYQAPAPTIGPNDKFTEPVVAYRRQLSETMTAKGLGSYTGDLRYMAYSELVTVANFMESPAVELMVISKQRLRKAIEDAQAAHKHLARCAEANLAAATYIAMMSQYIAQAMRVPMGPGADAELPYDYLAVDIEPCSWFACMR